MDDAVKIIKSLLTTSESGGMLINDINKEYKEIVGKPISFREFGFDTLTDFLRSTNQFSGTKTADGIKVTVKIPGKSAHIIAMRQKQNMSQAEKKRRKKAMMKCGTGGSRGGGGGGGGSSSACSGYNQSQQPKKSISSQVMKRSAGIITKQRPRAQPQRIISCNPIKSVAPSPQMITTAIQTIHNEPAPVNKTHPTEPLRTKVNLHDRFVKKQVFEPTVPAINSISSAFEPHTPSTSPIKLHSKSPETPLSKKQSCRSSLIARLEQTASSINSQTSVNDIGLSSLHTQQITSDGRPSRSKLLSRLTPKQLTSPTGSNHENGCHSNLLPIGGRSALLKIYQKMERDKKDSAESSNSLSGGIIDEHVLKPNDVNARIQSQAVPLKKPTRDLHARLAPKKIELTNGTEPIDNNSVKSSINTDDNTSNPIKQETNIGSRLQFKQIEKMESAELQQISQKLNDINLMEVDAATGESFANPLQGIKKPNLSARLQPKQFEMDWDQFNWVRSVKASNSQIKITVKLT